jgi:4-hydroxythreonine-4-phosphate dehydrogenase
MTPDKIRIGITHGDINSISYEVILNTLMDSRIAENCLVVFYGSAKVAAYHRKALNMGNITFNIVRSADEGRINKLNLVNYPNEDVRVELGKSTQVAGEASLWALEMAVKDLKAGKLDALVTGPINKQNVQSDKFKFKGHTEYFQSQFESKDVLMFMVSDVMRIGVATGHVPLDKVSSDINEEVLLSKLNLMNHSLLQDFGIPKAKIAVLGLNPHAGDNGILGHEENEVIIPALEKARNKGIMAIGPFPADGFFGSGAYTKYDAVLAMYHDQGLIPFKGISNDDGVNYTAGLPIVRTSPAHGTAYELAGKGIASPDSFRKAFYLAIDIIKKKRQYKEISKDPLKHYDLPSGKDEQIDITKMDDENI